MCWVTREPLVSLSPAINHTRSPSRRGMNTLAVVFLGMAIPVYADVMSTMVATTLSFSTSMSDHHIEAGHWGATVRQMHIECDSDSDCDSCDYGHGDGHKAAQGTVIDGVALQCECDRTGVNDCDCGKGTCPLDSICDHTHKLFHDQKDDGDCAPGLACSNSAAVCV